MDPTSNEIPGEGAEEKNKVKRYGADFSIISKHFCIQAFVLYRSTSKGASMIKMVRIRVQNPMIHLAASAHK